MFYQDSNCCRDIYINKYGTRTRVAELMCDQLGGDCSKENDHAKDGYRTRNDNCHRFGNSPRVSDCLRDGDSPEDCGSPWHLWANLFELNFGMAATD